MAFRKKSQDTQKTDPLIVAANKAKPTDELGVTGLLQWQGNITEAYRPNLYWPAAYKVYNEMLRRDPTIAALLNSIKLLARTASWTVEPASSAEPDQRAAEFLESCLGDMTITLEDAVEDLLTAIPFGWSWSEIVYKRRNRQSAEQSSAYDDGLIGWHKFAPRRQSSFSRWEFDDNGGLQGLHQAVMFDSRYMPITKSLHFTAQRDAGNPEGLALLESIYEAWHYVKTLQLYNGIGFERSFVGLPVFEYGDPEHPYTPDDSDEAEVRAMGQGLRQNSQAYVSYPASKLHFRLETVANPNAASLLETIKQYRVWMLQVALADFIALGTLTSGGSYALGQDKSELFLMAIDGWLDKLAHVDKLGIFNRYAVPRLFDYNTFDGITAYPRIKHSSVQKPNLPALSSYLQSLSAFITPNPELESELLRKANLPQRSDLPNETEDDANEPATGITEDGSTDINDLAHPPARDIKYFEVQWEQALAQFNEAINESKSVELAAPAPIELTPPMNLNIPVTVNLPPTATHITTPDVKVEMAAPQIDVQVPAQSAPQVIVNVPEQAAPIVNVTTPTPIVNVEAQASAPVVNVNPEVKLALPTETTETEVVERDPQGRAKKIRKARKYEA